MTRPGILTAKRNEAIFHCFYQKNVRSDLGIQLQIMVTGMTLMCSQAINLEGIIVTIASDTLQSKSSLRRSASAQRTLIEREPPLIISKQMAPGEPRLGPKGGRKCENDGRRRSSFHQSEIFERK